MIWSTDSLGGHAAAPSAKNVESYLASVSAMRRVDMSINKGMMTSNTGEWSTPQEFFDKLNAEFKFTLDPCASKDNAKCKQFFTKADDGLSKKWSGRVFCNPPYGREIGAWVKKAYDSVASGDVKIVVCLLPARTDTAWWHDYCMKGKLRFIRGRLKFGDGKNTAPFPSAVVIFR